MMTNFLRKYVYIVIVMSLSGCSQPRSMPSTNQITQTVIQTVDTLKSAAPTNLSTPIPTVTKTATTVPTWTPVPSHTPTITPLATLSTDEAKDLILEMVQKPSDCRLPCLWGFEPGKTSVNTIRAFAERFPTIMASDLEITRDDFGNMGLSYLKDNVMISIHLSYYQSKVSDIVDILTMYFFSLNQGVNPITKGPGYSPVWGDPTFNQEMQDYLLPAILSKYGQPAQVFVATWPDDPDRTDIKWQPFSLVLYYPDQGIFVEYVSPREASGNYFIGCPARAHISLGVWSPESNLSLKDIADKSGSVMNKLTLDYYRSIEDATGKSLTEFYEEFKQPDYAACLRTPKSLWNPY
jgi:hypothetical protein